MEIRPAESDDRERIRAITRDSLQSSYALSPQDIEMLLEEAFDDEALADLRASEDTRVRVAEETVDSTATLSGFVTVELNGAARIRWLHVDPERRGNGIATALLEQVFSETDEKPVRAAILEAAVEGGEFLEEFGLEQTANDHRQIGGEEFAVTVFTQGGGTEPANEPTVPVPDAVSVDGDDRPVDRDARVPGREAPFFVVSDETDPEQDAYGYFCSECGSTDVAADGLDRLECGACGNAHLAEEWDDAYL